MHQTNGLLSHTTRSALLFIEFDCRRLMKLNERLRARHALNPANTVTCHGQVPLLLPTHPALVPDGEPRTRTALLMVGTATAATSADGSAGRRSSTAHDPLQRHEQDHHQLRDKISTAGSTSKGERSHASSSSSSSPPPCPGAANQQQAQPHPQPQPQPPQLVSLFSEDGNADKNEGVGIHNCSASTSSAGLLAAKRIGNGTLSSKRGQRWDADADSTPSTMRRHWPDIGRGGQNDARRVSRLEESLPSSENESPEAFKYFTPHGQHRSTTPRSTLGIADLGDGRESTMNVSWPVFGEEGEARGAIAAPSPPVVGDDGLERRSSCGSLENVKKRLWGSMFEGECMSVCI